ncbi:MAG: hypothetical protein WBC95_10630 [Albidovulum sp.]
MRFMIYLALVAFWTVPAVARTLDPTDAAALDKSVSAYLQAIGKGDAKGIVAALPPRILNVYAGATGIEMSKLRTTLEKQTQALLKGTKFRDLSADQADLDATDEVLSDGETVSWIVVPSAFATVTDSIVTQHLQPLLAINEGGKWYFLRIEGPDSQALAALAYPFLADQELPAATATSP